MDRESAVGGAAGGQPRRQARGSAPCVGQRLPIDRPSRRKHRRRCGSRANWPQLRRCVSAAGEGVPASGRATEAIEAHQKAVAINPDDWLNHNTLGAAYLRLGDYDKAIEANPKVIELEPDNVNGYNDLGAAYLQTGQFEKAAARVRKGAQVLPNPAKMYTNLAIWYYFTGQVRGGGAVFRESGRAEPECRAVRWKPCGRLPMGGAERKSHGHLRPRYRVGAEAASA